MRIFYFLKISIVNFFSLRRLIFSAFSFSSSFFSLLFFDIFFFIKLTIFTYLWAYFEYLHLLRTCSECPARTSRSVFYTQKIFLMRSCLKHFKTSILTLSSNFLFRIAKVFPSNSLKLNLVKLFMFLDLKANAQLSPPSVSKFKSCSYLIGEYFYRCPICYFVQVYDT